MKTFLSLLLLIPSLSWGENFPKLFINFSGICVNGLDQLNGIYDLAKEKEWTVLPNEAKDLVRPMDGGDVDAWGFRDNETVIMIGIAERSVDGLNYSMCSMAGKGGFKENLNSLLNSYDLTLIDSQKQGIQVSDIYVYSHPAFGEFYISVLGSVADSIETFTFSAIGIN